MRKTATIVAIAAVLVIAAVVIIVCPSWLSALHLGGSSSDTPPPDEVIVNMLLPTKDTRFSRDHKLVKIQRGSPLVSEGKFGPVGTKVYPVRLTYSYTHPQAINPGAFDIKYTDVQDESTVEKRFWKNEFGEWKAD